MLMDQRDGADEAEAILSQYKLDSHLGSYFFDDESELLGVLVQVKELGGMKGKCMSWFRCPSTGRCFADIVLVN